MASLLNYHIQWTVIPKDTNQDNNKVVGYKSNKTVKFHRLEWNMEEAVSKCHSVVEAE